MREERRCISDLANLHFTKQTHNQRAMAASPSQSDAQPALLTPPPESESQISSLLYGKFHFSLTAASIFDFSCPKPLIVRFVAEISQQVQAEMEDMLKSIREIDENSGQITEEIDKCKESALEKKRGLEESKEQIEKAAYAVLQMLNNSGP
ncbi:hypothetical protein ACLB2K_073394 [Fragaria x ananassa]